MAPRGKITRSTATQINQLVDYMCVNPSFAVGQFTGPLGAQRIDAEWAQLTQMLAEYGPYKTVAQWKHTWRDLKKKARDEGGDARLAQIRTGNATPVPQLTERTRKILAIIGPECAEGIAVEQETGIGVAPIAIQAERAPEDLVVPYEDANADRQFDLDNLAEEIVIQIDNPTEEPREPPRARRRRGRARALPCRARLPEPPSAVFISVQRQTNNILQDIANVLTTNNQHIWKMRHNRRAQRGGIHKLAF